MYKYCAYKLLAKNINEFLKNLIFIKKVPKLEKCSPQRAYSTVESYREERK
jgi:hypothetical protein